eukprot:GEMP01032732.1.p1 GENE.GEMP01032732.1~~GEMP01032732.1.p1  ORF type:complete len:369 (+),score=65.33 GEMP01032732.1:678-1784(+)
MLWRVRVDHCYSCVHCRFLIHGHRQHLPPEGRYCVLRNRRPTYCEYDTNHLGARLRKVAEKGCGRYHDIGRDVGTGLGVKRHRWDHSPRRRGTHALFQRYIYMKSASCFGYGLSVGILLYVLKVDLAVVFGLTAFIFNFVPEVGAFIAMLLPLPVILLDSRIDNPFFTFAVASMGQMGLKFLFGTVLEVKMVESDQLMRMHPVVILVAVAFFGYLWGPTGMLVSVPIMGYFKISLLNDSVPAVYRDAILVFLEGDVDAPLWHTTKQIYLPDDLEKRRNPSNSMYSYDIEFSATADDADNMTTFALPPPVAPSTSLRRPARDTYAAISVTDTPELNKTVSPPQRRVAEAPTPRVARDERKTNQTHEFGS